MSRPIDLRRFSSETGRLARPRPSEALRSRTASSKGARKVVSMSRYGNLCVAGGGAIGRPSVPAVVAATAPAAPAPASTPPIAQRLKPAGGNGGGGGGGAPPPPPFHKPRTPHPP